MHNLCSWNGNTKHFVLIFLRLLSDSLVITQRIIKLVKNSKTYHSALHREIIFIPYVLMLLWWHITLFFTYKNMHSSLHNYVAIKVTHLDILNPTNHIWKNLTFHVVNSWNLHTLCKGLSIPYHPPLKMWIVIWLLRLVAISQEFLIKVVITCIHSTWIFPPWNICHSSSINPKLSISSFLLNNFFFSNFFFKCFISTFLVKPFLFSSPDSELRHVHVKNASLILKNYIFLFICKHVHLVLEAFYLGRFAPLHSFSMSI